MEFKNELERWHQIKDFAKMLTELADYHEMKAIRKCIHYEFDNQSAEEYCWYSSTRGKYGAARGLNGESEEICWKCPNYNTQQPKEEPQ